MKLANEVTELDKCKYNLVIWGTPENNPLVRTLCGSAGNGGGDGDSSFPISWGADEIKLHSNGSSPIDVGQHTSFPSVSHVPIGCYPSPWAAADARYVCLNSGLTFREAHDHTNSMQNPKLPDWAILCIDDIGTPLLPLPSDRGERAGAVVACGMFDEFWRL